MKSLILFSILSILSLTVSSQNWEQLGNDINGSAMSDYFGTNASLSSDGNTVAVGAPYNDDNGNKAGQIRVFAYDGTSWIQRGNNINGVAGMDYASLVALSADGATVAVASTGNYSIKARVLDFDGVEWIQRGISIAGPDGELSGGDMSMSADGDRIILSYPGNSSNTGVIRIYEWSDMSWDQLGSDIIGNASGDKFGRHVKLNADGNTFITSTEYYPTPSALNGQVRVYDYSGNDWIQRGNDITGDQQYASLGSSVDISYDGNTIIAGEPGFKNGGSSVGRASVFNWNGSAWVLMGDPIEGIANLDKTGNVVAINGIANTIATKGVGGSELGNVRVFQFDGTGWVQQGQTIVGIQGDAIGYGLDFNTSGDRICIGNTGIDFNTGQMKVYHYDGTTGLFTNNVENGLLYPNPSTGNIRIDLGKVYADLTIEITNSVGQKVSTKKVAFAENIQLEIDGAAGIYFVRISSDEGSSTFKVIKD